MRIPRIGGPNCHNFHDSSLLEFELSPQLDEIICILSTPDEYNFQNIWQLSFSGVLRFEYEVTGEGIGEAFPIEIYDIYKLEESDELNRWKKRLELLEIPNDQVEKLNHIVLASSFYRGWGKNKDLEGINIICRDVTVCPAPAHFEKFKVKRPTIESDS